MATIRNFIDSDAAEIIESVRETYGEEYPNAFMYDVQLLRNACHDGKIKLTVAEADSGEIMGHIGLISDENMFGAVEVVCLIVKRKYRAFDIGTKLFEICVRKADSESIPSIYGTAVMINDYSQRIMQKLGYTATGFWLNRKPFYDIIKNGKAYVNEKLSFLVLVRNKNIASCGVLYLTQRYISFAQKVYDKLNVKVEFCQKKVECSCEKTIYKISEKNEYLNKNIFIYQTGKDCSELIKTYSVLDSELASVSVFLNLKSPSAYLSIEQLEKIGYKFEGFLPLAGDNEFIIFHLCKCNVKCDEFLICEQFNYIKNELVLI